MHTHTHTHTHIHTYAHTHKCSHTHSHTHTHTHTLMHTYIHTNAYTHTCTHTLMLTHTHTHTHSHTHTHTHTHSHAHTHIHTHTYQYTHTYNQCTHMCTHTNKHTYTPCKNIRNMLFFPDTSTSEFLKLSIVNLHLSFCVICFFSIISSQTSPQDIWIGLYKTSADDPSTLRWVDDTTFVFNDPSYYQPWNIGEPNEDDAIGVRIRLAFSKWADNDREYWAICEKGIETFS